MNKTFFGILLAVCLLGMALAIFSERLSREPENKSMQMAAADTQLPSLAKSNSPAVPAIPEPPTQADAVSAPENPRLAAETEKRELEAAQAALASPPAGQRPPEELPKPEAAPLAAKDIPAQINSVQPQRPLPEALPETVAPRKPVAQAIPVAKPEPAPSSRPEIVTPPKADNPVPAVRPETTTSPNVANHAPAARTEPKKINNFVVFARDKGATVRMGGSAKINYSSMTLENPHRVVVDMDGDWEFPERLPIPKNEMVSGIRVGKNGDKTRVVIDLKVKPRVSRMVSNQNGASIDVRVDK